MRIGGAWVIVFLIAMCPIGPISPISSVARADNRSAARAHYEAASKAYDVGDYDEAIRELTAAYELRPDPNLLYNFAQAHRLAGHKVEALRAYRKYLTKLPNAPNRAEVERYIGELSESAPLPASPEVRTHATPLEQPAPAPIAVTDWDPDLTVTQAPPPATKRRAWVIPVAVVGAVVVVGLAVGLGVGLGVSPSTLHAAHVVTVP